MADTMLEGCFYVPASAAVCPACGGALTYQPDAWEEQDDGRYHVIGGMIECENEDDGNPDEPHAGMWRMPYVYWLPVEKAVLVWLNTRTPERP